jgi:hypothetical protein
MIFKGHQAEKNSLHPGYKPRSLQPFTYFKIGPTFLGRGLCILEDILIDLDYNQI